MLTPCRLNFVRQFAPRLSRPLVFRKHYSTPKIHRTQGANEHHEVSKALGHEYNLEELARLQSVSRRGPEHKQPTDKPIFRDGEEGKLVSTPSRLMKLLLPLNPTNDSTTNSPLALLAHPHQPLSYLERLLQSELQPLPDTTPPRPPTITFLSPSSVSSTSPHTTPHTDKTLVRWSAATEIGDFLRDASKSHYFLLAVERHSPPLRVAVPSFGERTYFLRQRLRAVSSDIAAQEKLKSECDNLAHRGAQRIALGGFAGLVGWWGAVYYATFKTELGWDVMEPVTYLVGLSGIISGYLWFLYHNREVSYRSVLHLTVSRRQMRLYEQRGFELERWHEAIEEGRGLRREIKQIAEEYDVDWKEGEEEVLGEKVKKVLDKEDRKERRNEGKEQDEAEENEDDRGGKEK